MKTVRIVSVAPSEQGVTVYLSDGTKLEGVSRIDIEPITPSGAIRARLTMLANIDLVAQCNDVASMAPPSSIAWIDVDVRVPNDRRKVLAWGNEWTSLRPGPARPKFFGVTRFNQIADGGIWDVERGNHLSIFTRRVTHWAEIAGPAALRKPPSPTPPPRVVE